MEVGLPDTMDFIYFDSRCITHLFQKEEMAVILHRILLHLSIVSQLRLPSIRLIRSQIQPAFITRGEKCGLELFNNKSLWHCRHMNTDSVIQAFMVQEFIEEAGGSDLRCFVVGESVIRRAGHTTSIIMLGEDDACYRNRSGKAAYV